MTAGQEQRPAQHQEQQPGRESEMTPQPQAEDFKYQGSGKLRDKVALITGGDSGMVVQLRSLMPKKALMWRSCT